MFLLSIYLYSIYWIWGLCVTNISRSAKFQKTLIVLAKPPFRCTLDHLVKVWKTLLCKVQIESSSCAVCCVTFPPVPSSYRKHSLSSIFTIKCLSSFLWAYILVCIAWFPCLLKGPPAVQTTQTCCLTGIRLEVFLGTDFTVLFVIINLQSIKVIKTVWCKSYNRDKKKLKMTIYLIIG